MTRSNIDRRDQSIKRGSVKLIDRSGSWDDPADTDRTSFLIGSITDRVDNGLKTKPNLDSHIFQIPDMNAQTMPISIEELVRVQESCDA